MACTFLRHPPNFTKDRKSAGVLYKEATPPTISKAAATERDCAGQARPRLWSFPKAIAILRSETGKCDRHHLEHLPYGLAWAFSETSQ